VISRPNFVAIKQVIISHEVPEGLRDWLEDMNADSNLTVSRGDRTIEGKPDKF